MNVADRLAYETAVEDQRNSDQQQRERAQRATEDATATLRRRAAPELVYRTTVTDEPEERTVTITPPQVAPNETQVWWQWTQQRLAAQKSQIESDIAAQFNMYDEAVGAALGEKCCDLREHFERELNFVKREMEQAGYRVQQELTFLDRQSFLIFSINR